MNASSNVETELSNGEAAWNAALVQVEYARRDYALCLDASDRLRLWQAERLRDELFRRME